MESEILELLKEIQKTLELNLKDWMPLITTTIGGFIALSGSFGGQIIQSKLAKQKEINNQLKEKLEMIGNLSNEFEDALQIDMAQIYDVAVKPDISIAPVHKRLNILLLNVRLYHSVLSCSADKLEQACLNYLNKKRDITNNQIQKAITQLTDAHLQKLVVAFQQCLEAKKELLEKVVAEANNYRNK